MRICVSDKTQIFLFFSDFHVFTNRKFRNFLEKTIKTHPKDMKRDADPKKCLKNFSLYIDKRNSKRDDFEYTILNSVF